MFVLLFTFVFGDVIAVPAASSPYLIGGILVQTLTFGVAGAGRRRSPPT